MSLFDRISNRNVKSPSFEERQNTADAIAAAAQSVIEDAVLDLEYAAGEQTALSIDIQTEVDELLFVAFDAEDASDLYADQALRVRSALLA